MQNEKELFNLRHSALRVTVERAFGSLKRIFKILDDATPFFPFSTQVDIVVACCIMHNWVLRDGFDEFIILETNYIPNHNYAFMLIHQVAKLVSINIWLILGRELLMLCGKTAKIIYMIKDMCALLNFHCIVIKTCVAC